MNAVRAAESARVADEQRARAVGQEQPLVRIERDRVRALEPAEGVPPALGEDEEPAVGGIHVQPQPLRARELGRGLEVVHRARVRRARAHDQEEGTASGGPIRRHRLRQGIEANPESLVGGDGAHARRREPGQQGRLLDRVMRLVGCVEDAGEEVLGQALAAGGHERDEVGHRSAGGEEAEGGRRIAHHLAEPAADVRFELDQTRRGHPHADEAIGHVRDEVGDAGVEEPASGNVGEIAGAGGVEALRHRPLEESRQQLLVGRAILGQALAQRPRQLRRARDVGRGLARQGLDVRDQPLEGEPDEPPHLRRGPSSSSLMARGRRPHGMSSRRRARPRTVSRGTARPP